MTIAAILLLAGAQALTSHTFEFVSDKDYQTVTVAGTFNGWNKKANPLEKKSGRYTITLKLPLGKHHYKFVLNDTDWIIDPKAVKNEDDGNGNTNSVLMLLPADYQKPAKRGDSIITASAVKHLQTVPDLNYDRGRLTLRVQVRPNDVGLIELRAGGKSLPLKQLSGDDFVETHEVSIPWDRKGDLKYHFALIDGYSANCLGPDGLAPLAKKKDFVLSAKKFQPFVVPAWVEQTVFYQIFPDRFENGDKTNDPKDVEAWNATPKYFNRFGGDAAGIRKRTSHLTDLGVNGIYINPIMEAPANHRYDPADFYKVDDEFATNEDFGKLTRELKQAGIRTVLDQIFDHVGVTFPPFVDLLKNQQNSKYRDWFFVKAWPVEVRQNPPYEAWWGYESMPKINLAQPDARKYLLDSVNFWHKNADLAGWRLDVANEPPQWFWREFRERVKSINPDTWIVGEVWDNASEWLKGDQWDASMNYPFRGVVLGHIAQGRTSASQFLNGLMNVYGWLAPQASRNQLNLLSSHDTPRFITECGGDRRLAKLGATVQMTWVGAPSIYYGEELGMEGGADPANRAGMRWDLATKDNDMLAHYRRLIALRRSSKVLQSGDPVAIHADDGKKVAVYGRELGDELVVVATNRSESVQTVTVKIPAGAKAAGFANALTHKPLPRQGSNLTLTIPPLDAVIAAPTNRIQSSKQSTKRSHL